MRSANKETSAEHIVEAASPLLDGVQLPERQVVALRYPLAYSVHGQVLPESREGIKPWANEYHDRGFRLLLAWNDGTDVLTVWERWADDDEAGKSCR